MNGITQCPECHSTNINIYEARKSYTCINCGLSFSEKEFTKLRIFLSYGHDHNEELVRMIKTDLEKRDMMCCSIRMRKILAMNGNALTC